MADEKEHLAAAAENKQLGLTLLVSPLSPRWSVVLAFYSALHLVDAYLVRVGYRPRNHEDRRASIQRLRELRPLWEDYRTLDTRSREARYDFKPFTAPQAR